MFQEYLNYDGKKQKFTKMRDVLMPYVLGGRLHQSQGLFFEDKGQGVPLFLVQGLGRSMRHWMGFDQLLANDYRVIAIDNRGIGRSKDLPMTRRHRVDDLASDIVSVMNALEIERAHIVGQSLGGMITMALGYHHPGRVSSIAIMNSSIANTGQSRISLAAAAKLITQGITNRKRQQILARYLLAKLPEAKRKDTILAWQQIEDEEPTKISQVLGQLWAALHFDAQEKLAQITAPCLVLAGSEDAFVPNKNSEILHQSIPHSRLEFIAGGGHEMTVDSPSLVRDAIMNFHNDMAD